MSIEVFPIAEVVGRTNMFMPKNDWHAPRGDRLHYGNDLFANLDATKKNVEGSPIVAVTSGVVKFDEGANNPLGGLTAGLQGDDGVWYYYAHLRDFVGASGRRVAAGEVIGHLGMTGAAALVGVPHLHFGMKPHPGSDEAWIDPWADLHAAARVSGEAERVTSGAALGLAMIAAAAVVGGFMAMLHFLPARQVARRVARHNPIAGATRKDGRPKTWSMIRGGRLYFIYPEGDRWCVESPGQRTRCDFASKVAAMTWVKSLP